MHRKNNKKRKLNPIFSAPKLSDINSHFNHSGPSHWGFLCDPNFVLFFYLQRAVFAVCRTSAVHEFNHGMAPCGGYRPFHVNPRHYSCLYSNTYYHSASSAIFAPGRSLGSDPYPGGSGMSTVTHAPEMQPFCSLMEHWEGLCMDCSCLWCISRHPSALRASYGTPDPSLREVQPHHTFPDASYLSGCGLSTVTHLPGISGRSSSFGTIRPPQYELQPQSAIPGDPHLSDPAMSSVTHPSVIAREKRPGNEAAVIRFPSDEPLHGAHSQNVIPGVPYLSGRVAFLVTHRPEIPGRVSAYGTLRAHPPSSQSEKSPLMGEYEQNADEEFD